MAQLPHMRTRLKKYEASHTAGTAVFASSHSWVDAGFARSTKSGQRVAQSRSSLRTYRVERVGGRSTPTSAPVVERNYSRSVST